MTVSKDYYKGRLGAFNAVLAAMNQYNKHTLGTKVPKEVMSAVETLAITSGEQMDNCPDYDGSLKSAMEMVGQYLLDGAKEMKG